MEPTDTINLISGQGQEHEFRIYPIGTPFPEIEGLYVYTKEGTVLSPWPPIYIGETEDLSTRFDNHHKAQCAAEHGATHIGVCVSNMDSYWMRYMAEQELIKSHNPPCND